MLVGIFEERTQDPALYENHEHVLRLMEKFLFIAAPVQFPGEITETNSADEEVTYYCGNSGSPWKLPSAWVLNEFLPASFQFC